MCDTMILFCNCPSNTCIYKVRGAKEDFEIVTLLLGNLALALDKDGTFDVDQDGNLSLDTVGAFNLGSLFQHFGSNLRKLQVAPSGI